MKDQRRKRRVLFSWILLLFSLAAFTSFLLIFREGLRPRLVISSLLTTQLQAVPGEIQPPVTPPPVFPVRETVIFPDQVLLFLKYDNSPQTPLLTRDAIFCVYTPTSDSSRGGEQFHRPAKSVDDEDDNHSGKVIVRCPATPRGFIVSLSANPLPNGNLPVPGPTSRWDSLAYEALLDRDDSTVVFVKGYNLRSGQLTNHTRFKCMYGWDHHGSAGPTKTKFVIQSDVVSIAQEIVRCQTPVSILSTATGNGNDTVKVSVRAIGRRDPLKSVARLSTRLAPGPIKKQHEMCVCTVLRNQAQFLKEWAMYHSRIGVGRWFIYDNNSDDGLESVVQSLAETNHNVTRHLWPWIKTQEAGFAHCALRARSSCEWVGFIDVDEFLHFHSRRTSNLHQVLSKYSGGGRIGELRINCLNFGPSGQKSIPARGVTVGYTCRVKAPERHKSIVRPEALDPALINVVHHFHLKSGYRHVNLQNVVINHYKYQVWEVFKEKFYMRVSTYVSDWQRQQNAGSNDRTPGLGTKAVEPADWSSRFCEVNDTGLRDRVLRRFADPVTGRLPWL